MTDKDCPACSIMLARIEALHANSESAMRENVRLKRVDEHLRTAQEREMGLKRELEALRNANRELLALRDLRTAVRSALTKYDYADSDDDRAY